MRSVMDNHGLNKPELPYEIRGRGLFDAPDAPRRNRLVVPAPVKEDSRLFVLGIKLLGELLSQIMNPDRNVVNKMGFFWERSLTTSAWSEGSGRNHRGKVIGVSIR